MLGNAEGNAPGGYLHLNKEFEIVGRWENSMGDIPFSYDFWYQPRHNVMVSSEWAAPKTFMPGFDLEEVGHLKYGRRLHIWDFKKKKPIETMYLGEDGLNKGIRVRISSFTRHHINITMTKAKACGYYINSILAKAEAAAEREVMKSNPVIPSKTATAP